MIVRILLTKLVLILLALPLNMQAQCVYGDVTKFNAGERIIGYILDGHEWHLATIGDRSIAIPLPIILLSERRFHIFMSSRFQQGNADWRGFRWARDGEYQGRIVRVDAQGNLVVREDSEGNIAAILPIDLSITRNVFSLMFAAVFLFFMMMKVAKAYKQRGSNQAPTGFQNAIEPAIMLVRNSIAKQMLPAKYVDKHLPYLLTLFFFILFLNLLGLVPIFPGGANVTGNIAVTGGLALLTLISTFALGKQHYFRHLVDYPGVPWWLKFPLPIMPVIELIGVLIKPVTLAIRLTANMMSGKMVIVSIIFVIFILGKISPQLGYGISPLSVFFVIFITGLKALISVIQAYVFTLLTALYFGTALQEVDHAESGHAHH